MFPEANSPPPNEATGCATKPQGIKMDRHHLTSPGVIENWSQWLHFDNMEQEEKLRKCTMAGLVCGGKSFVKKIERRLKRKLVPGKRGRPAKKK
jgi:hypothetical protein